MNFLEIFFLVSGCIILVLGIDIATKKRFNALHFIIFIAIGCGLLIASISPSIVNQIGKIVGIQKGADALVYMSIVFLFYFSLLLLRRLENQREDTTKLIREIALMESIAPKNTPNHH